MSVGKPEVAMRPYQCAWRTRRPLAERKWEMKKNILLGLLFGAFFNDLT